MKREKMALLVGELSSRERNNVLKKTIKNYMQI